MPFAALVAGMMLAASGYFCGPLLAQDAGPTGDVWSRTILHLDGTRTDSKKDIEKNCITEETYEMVGERSIMIAKRIFALDSKARLRWGQIFDGKGTSLGHVEYGYDKYDRINEQRVFDRKGRMISQLFPPGARPDIPANRTSTIRLNYNPETPAAAPSMEATSDKIIQPVEQPMDNFVPGMPIHAGKSPPKKDADAGGTSTKSGRKPSPLLQQKKDR
jgi:hypothetical protein